MNTLTPSQYQALSFFAASQGRYWKQALRLAWQTGDYMGCECAPELQQIRNSFGPSWLVDFRFKKTA